MYMKNKPKSIVIADILHSLHTVCLCDSMCWGKKGMLRFMCCYLLYKVQTSDLFRKQIESSKYIFCKVNRRKWNALVTGFLSYVSWISPNFRVTCNGLSDWLISKMINSPNKMVLEHPLHLEFNIINSKY